MFALDFHSTLNCLWPVALSAAAWWRNVRGLGVRGLGERGHGNSRAIERASQRACARAASAARSTDAPARHRRRLQLCLGNDLHAIALRCVMNATFAVCVRTEGCQKAGHSRSASNSLGAQQSFMVKTQVAQQCRRGRSDNQWQ